MNRAYQATFLLLGAIAGCLGLILLTKNPSHKSNTEFAKTATPAIPATAALSVADGPSVEAPSANMQSSGGRTFKAPSSTHIIVLDKATYSPIEGALVVLEGAVARAVKKDGSGTIGLSNTNGVVDVAKSRLTLEPIVVMASGYLPSTLDAGSLYDGEETVLLSHGNQLSIQCSDVHGLPVADAAVFASRRQLPSRLHLSSYASNNFVPGVGVAGTFWATTDAQGIGVIHGVPAGQYICSAIKDGYAITTITPTGGIAVPSLDAVTVVLCPLYGVAVEVPDDEIMAGSIQHTHPIEQSGTRQWRDIYSTADALKVRFPASIAHVFMISDEHYLKDPATVDILLRRRGVARFEVPLRPLAEITQPFRPDLDVPLASDGCYPVEVVISSRNGLESLDGTFLIEVGAGIGIWLTNGKIYLPAGRYEIQCMDNRLQHYYTPTYFEVPGNVSISVLADLISCNFTLTDAEESMYDSFTLAVTALGRTTVHSTLDKKQITVPLPPGPATLTASVWGFQRAETSVYVSARGLSQDFTIRLTE